METWIVYKWQMEFEFLDFFLGGRLIKEFKGV